MDSLGASGRVLLMRKHWRVPRRVDLNRYWPGSRGIRVLLPPLMSDRSSVLGEEGVDRAMSVCRGVEGRVRVGRDRGGRVGGGCVNRLEWRDCTLGVEEERVGAEAFRLEGRVGK